MRFTSPLRLALIACACATLAACARGDESTADPAATAPHVACAEPAIIAPGGAHCGVGLTPNSAVTLDGLPQAGGTPLIVTSGVERRASSLMIYPSPGGRFLLVRGCEGPTAEPGICWRALLLDRSGADARDLTFRSHYGPSEHIFWAPDNMRFAVVEPMEGFEALTIVNAATGAVASFPAEGGVDNFRVNEASIAWTSPTTITASIEVCNGDTGVCAAAAQQTFAAP